MTIIWKDTTLRLHGKRHKGDRYYFRWHYGKQRVVQMSGEYVDKPTEKQKSAREAFTELRREVARQLRDAELRAAWMRKFEEDNEGYKMLHTYVYAKLKKSPLQLPPQGESCVAADSEVTGTTMRRGDALVSTSKGIQETHMKGVSTRGKSVCTKGSPLSETQYMAARGVLPVMILHNYTIVPIFLPNQVPKRKGRQVDKWASG